MAWRLSRPPAERDRGGHGAEAELRILASTDLDGTPSISIYCAGTPAKTVRAALLLVAARRTV
jgi:hypothetical protein